MHRKVDVIVNYMAPLRFKASYRKILIISVINYGIL